MPLYRFMILQNGPSLSLKLFVNSKQKLYKAELSERDENGLKVIFSDNSPTKKIVKWLEAYIENTVLSPFSFLDLSNLSFFEKKVLEEIHDIPFGTTLSYKELASLIRGPQHARAVGNALGKNPVPLFLPCHRVIASSGKIGGFSCGLPIKQILCDFEKIKIGSFF